MKENSSPATSISSNSRWQFKRIFPDLTEVFAEIFYAANPALYESLKIIFAVSWGNHKFKTFQNQVQNSIQGKARPNSFNF